MIVSLLRKSLIAICTILLSGVAALGAIGVYDWSATTTSGEPPVQIQYRLNIAGSVAIEILDQAGRAVHTLGPFEETAGLQIHQWDGSGAANNGAYRVRITASSPGSGSPGTLVRLFGGQGSLSIYGLAIDRFAESPGYGTIYVSNVIPGGRVRAYRPDGSVKTEFGTNGVLDLGFSTYPRNAPYGIGIDRLGCIYVSQTSVSQTQYGVKVFDYLGREMEQYHVFPAQAKGIFWLEGLVGPQGPEVYESYGDQVRACVIGDTDWHTAIPAIAGTTPKQFCFETGGQACYVATYGPSSDPGEPNPGVSRYVRQSGGEWTRDAGFDCGLSGHLYGPLPASERVVGVSCDARAAGTPNGYGATSLWMGLDSRNDTFGGNIVRKSLGDGALTFFGGPDSRSRFVAADAVGNVAIEYGVPLGTDPLWSWWGLYAPCGEPSTDTRTTAAFVLAGSASPEVLSTLSELKARPDGTLVVMSAGKLVTAAYDGCFYIGEALGSCGLKVKCATPVAEGALVRVGGALGTEYGERVLEEAEVLEP